jgi:hypothetical protein
MAIKNLLRTVFSSKAKIADDGRDQWPSRLSFILAAMGGCVGLGNILRYVCELPISALQHNASQMLTLPSRHKYTTTSDYNGSSPTSSVGITTTTLHTTA